MELKLANAAHTSEGDLKEAVLNACVLAQNEIFDQLKNKFESPHFASEMVHDSLIFSFL